MLTLKQLYKQANLTDPDLYAYKVLTSFENQPCPDFYTHLRRTGKTTRLCMNIILMCLSQHVESVTIYKNSFKNRTSYIAFTERLQELAPLTISISVLGDHISVKRDNLVKPIEIETDPKDLIKLLAKLDDVVFTIHSKPEVIGC